MMSSVSEESDMKDIEKEVAARQEAAKRRIIGIARQAWRPRSERPRKGAGSYRRDRSVPADHHA